MSEIKTIKVTAELKRMIDDTARHCDVDVSDVLRSVAVGMRHGRPVTYFEKINHVTKPGKCQVRIADGVLLPAGVTVAAFREALAARCLEELAKPVRPAAKITARIGVDYVMAAGE